MSEKNIWLDGIMGVVIGDALGCPVQFMSREKLIARGLVTGMEGYGSFHVPEGTWTDDSSLTLALLDSINQEKKIDLDAIMDRFIDWLRNGEYTPFGQSFDIGNTCYLAITRYERSRDIKNCGMNFEEANGNGSLMRIIPACLYAYMKKMPIDVSLKMIHEVSGLTHNHIRSHIACGLYYFCVCSILDNDGTLCTRLQKAMNDGFFFYERSEIYRGELKHYARLRDLNMFKSVPEDDIRSSGYVVDSLEAALWALLKTNTFKECLLRAVNLAYDADTIGAIAGGLAGLYYGYDNIPKDWLDKIKKREFIEEMCLVEI